MSERVDIAGGKYTFILNSKGTIEDILRYGEPWSAGRQYIHSKLLLVLLHEYKELKHRIDSLEK